MRGPPRYGKRPRPSAVLLGAVLALVLSGCSGSSSAVPSCGPTPAGFAHREATVGGTRLHYVVGGSGPGIVLLHGFPETWQSWSEVMTQLADRHTVVAPDLRGVGCSSLEPAGYDKESLARDVHELVATVGLERVALVGHDLGGWVAFAYARSYPDEVSHLVLSGAVLPGFGLDRLLDFRRPGQGLAHLVFFQQPDLPELLITGREREFLSRFVASPRVLNSAAFDAAVRAYSRPGRLTAALEQYRTLHADAAANRRGLSEPLRVPTLALDGAAAVDGTTASLREVATDVREVRIPDAGHYALQERPDEFAAQLLRFIDNR